MKNYKKYADEIREYRGCEFCEAFIIPNILKSDNCKGGAEFGATMKS